LHDLLSILLHCGLRTDLSNFCPFHLALPRQLDSLDHRILKEIISPGAIRWNVREPYSKISGRLAVDEETVRRRVARLREAGVIGKFVLFLNPSLLDRSGAFVYLESRDPESLAKGASKLELMDGITSIVSLHEAGLFLDIYYQSDSALARQIALVESICQAKTTMMWRWVHPQFTSTLSKTDWLIIDAIRRDPRRKISDLASNLDVSTRTLTRRVTRLNDGNAFFLDLEFDIAKISGLPCLLLVHLEDRMKKREADKMIQSGIQKLVYVDTTAANNSVFAFLCDNVPEAESISRWVRRISGVDEAKIGIIKSRIYNFDWVNDEIQRRINAF
jgi:DNA-binding Lrp family transcriptional regulator